MPTHPQVHESERPDTRPAGSEEPERFSMRVGWRDDIHRGEAAAALDPTPPPALSGVREAWRRGLARAMSSLREHFGVDGAL